MLVGCVNTADVGTVNDKKISKGMFNLFALSAVGEIIQENGLSSYEEFEALNVNGMSGKQLVIDRAYDLILEKYTGERLFYAAGNKLTDEQEAAVNTYISDMVQSMGGQAAFDNELKTLEVTQSEFKDFQRTNVIYSVYANMIYGESGTQPITDSDAKDFYDKNYVCAKHILISTIDQATQAPVSDEQKVAALAKAQEALEKIQAGADFDAMIAEYNEDPGMESNPDGYLFTHGEMVKTFEDAAFALSVGEVSDIVESQFGYHIIKKMDKNADASLYEGVKIDIYNSLVVERFNSYIEENKSGTSITKNNEQAQKIDLEKFLVS
jgi:parvulin-like peptidyl-prolyl isomerase